MGKLLIRFVPNFYISSTPKKALGCLLLTASFLSAEKAESNTRPPTESFLFQPENSLSLRQLQKEADKSVPATRLSQEEALRKWINSDSAPQAQTVTNSELQLQQLIESSVRTWITNNPAESNKTLGDKVPAAANLLEITGHDWNKLVNLKSGSASIMTGGLAGEPFAKAFFKEVFSNDKATLELLNQSSSNKEYAEKIIQFLKEFDQQKGPLWELFSPSEKEQLAKADLPREELKKLLARKMVVFFAKKANPLNSTIEAPHVSQAGDPLAFCKQLSPQHNAIDCRTGRPVSGVKNPIYLVSPEEVKTLYDSALLTDNAELINYAARGGYPIHNLTDGSLDNIEVKNEVMLYAYKGCVYKHLQERAFNKNSHDQVEVLEKTQNECMNYVFKSSEMTASFKEKIKQQVMQNFLEQELISELSLGHLGKNYKSIPGHEDKLEKMQEFLSKVAPSAGEATASAEPFLKSLSQEIEANYGIKLDFECKNDTIKNSDNFREFYKATEGEDIQANNTLLCSGPPSLNLNAALKNKSPEQLSRMFSDPKFWQYINILYANNHLELNANETGKIDTSNSSLFGILKFAALYQGANQNDQGIKLDNPEHDFYKSLSTVNPELSKMLLSEMQKIVPDIKRDKDSRMSLNYHAHRDPIFIDNSVIVPMPDGSLSHLTRAEYEQKVRDNLGELYQISRKLIEKGKDTSSFWNTMGNGVANYFKTLGDAASVGVAPYRLMFDDSIFEPIEVGHKFSDFAKDTHVSMETAAKISSELSLLGIFKTSEENAKQKNFYADSRMGGYRALLTKVVTPTQIFDQTNEAYLEGVKTGIWTGFDIATIMLPLPKGLGPLRVMSGTAAAGGKAALLATRAGYTGLKTLITNPRAAMAGAKAGFHATKAAFESTRALKAMSWSQRLKTINASTRAVTEGSGAIASAYQFGSKMAWTNLAFFKGIGGAFGLGAPAVVGMWNGKDKWYEEGFLDAAGKVLVTGNDAKTIMEQSAIMGFAYFGGAALKEGMMAKRIASLPPQHQQAYKAFYQKTLDGGVNIKRFANSGDVSRQGLSSIRTRLQSTPPGSISEAQIAMDLKAMQAMPDVVGNVVPSIPISGLMHLREEADFQKQEDDLRKAREQLEQQKALAETKGDLKNLETQIKAIDDSLAAIETQRKASWSLDVLMTGATARFNASLNNINLNASLAQKANMMEAELAPIALRYTPIHVSKTGEGFKTYKISEGDAKKLIRASDKTYSNAEAEARLTATNSRFEVAGQQDTGFKGLLKALTGQQRMVDTGIESESMVLFDIPVPYEVIKNAKGEYVLYVYPKGTKATHAYDAFTDSIIKPTLPP